MPFFISRGGSAAICDQYGEAAKEPNPKRRKIDFMCLASRTVRAKLLFVSGCYRTATALDESGLILGTGWVRYGDIDGLGFVDNATHGGVDQIDSQGGIGIGIPCQQGGS